MSNSSSYIFLLWPLLGLSLCWLLSDSFPAYYVESHGKVKKKDPTYNTFCARVRYTFFEKEQKYIILLLPLRGGGCHVSMCYALICLPFFGGFAPIPFRRRGRVC